MFNSSAENKILSLSDLTAGITRVIGERFATPVWVRAELAKLNHYPESGHCYPALVEKEKGKIMAEMRGTIWANDYQRINQRFLQVTRAPLREGIQILFRAMVRFHPVYGLSLQISDIDPTYTLGEMAREKLATIEQLKKEGKWDLNRSLPMPVLPQRIAVISVKTSKGFSDFISILQNNAWGYSFSCILFPALLQGDKAVESILGQLEKIRQYRQYFDAVAIIRGGGGDVGLNCYDHYALAETVAAFPLPVLGGIGHSTNETVVEMVAARNLITPTDLAYFLIQQFHNFSARLQELGGEITGFATDLLEMEKRKKADLEKKLIQDAGFMIGEGRSVLESLSRDLAGFSKDSLHGQQIIIQEMESRFKLRPLQTLEMAAGALAQKTRILEIRAGQMFLQQAMRLTQSENQVRALDPVNVLKRGYSITYFKGKALKDAATVNIGDELTTKLYSGTVRSEVKSKSE